MNLYKVIRAETAFWGEFISAIVYAKSEKHAEKLVRCSLLPKEKVSLCVIPITNIDEGKEAILSYHTCEESQTYRYGK